MTAVLVFVAIVAAPKGPAGRPGARGPAAKSGKAAAAPSKGVELASMKQLYLEQRFDEALPVIDGLLQRKDLSDDERVLVLKHQAFVLFLQSLHDAAKRSWLALLQVNPDYALDPDEVSPEFLAFFGRIQPPGPTPVAPSAPLPAAAPTTVEPSTPPQESAAAPAVESTRITETIIATPATELAAEEALAREMPPVAPRGCGLALCFIPFGVGQFMNDQPIKGGVFSGLAAVALGVNLGMYWSRANEVTDVGYYADPDGAATRLTVQRVAFISLFVVGVAGVVDALLLYE